MTDICTTGTATGSSSDGAWEESAERYSCEWIEGGIAFNRRSLHACLIVHHRTGMPFFADYNGETLPIDAILRLRNEIREANRSKERHPACKGCAHLKLSRWPKSDYLIDIVGIAQYSHCNVECNYCFLQTQDPASFSSGYRPYKLFDTIRALLDDGTLAPNAILDWGGGEPTIYREFDKIVALTLERGARHYLHTNGVQFPDFVQGHPQAHNLHVICSIDAGFPETYRRMKNRDYFETVWRNLSSYMRVGCKVTIKYIVRQENCSTEEVEAFIRRAVEIGATDLITDIDYDFPDPTLEIVAALAKLRHLGIRGGLHVRHGFTGANFTNEDSVEARVQAAFLREQFQRINEIMRRHKYAVSESVDVTVETLVDTLFEHCAVKDREIASKDRALHDLLGECAAKDAAIQAKDAVLHEQGKKLRCFEAAGRFQAGFFRKVLARMSAAVRR